MITIWNWISDNYGFLSFIFISFFGLLIKVRKYIKDAIIFFDIVSGFRNFFGDQPAKVISETNKILQFACDTVEARVRISEKFLKIGIYICDLDGQCIWTNETLNETFGLDSTEMLGLGWSQAISPKDRKRVYEEWMFSIHEGLEYNTQYTIINLRNKKEYDVKTTAIAVYNEKKDKQCYVGYLQVENIRDETTQKNSKKAKDSSNNSADIG